jgi:hypothetical protein
MNDREDDDEQTRFEEISFHGVNDEVDKFGAVVNGLNLDVSRQRRLDLVELRLHGPGGGGSNIARVPVALRNLGRAGIFLE